MKFTTYTDDTDTQEYITQSGDDKHSKVNKFIFTGFSNKLHPYYHNQLAWIVKILKSQDVILSLQIVPTERDLGDDEYAGTFLPEQVVIKNETLLPPSKDSNRYILIMDEEIGNGWALLLKIAADGKREIITQEHRSGVIRELLEGDWIRSFGIDYQVEKVEYLDLIK